ncbi:MAG: PspC domain-containing protein, partial [Bacteroidota bacterium]
MNKVFNINLGGYPFTIDDNAYQHLSSYLKTIHNHFKHSEGYEEITSDIETRIAELFQESLGNHSIVTLKMVKETIVIMGTPEEFGANPIDDRFEDDSFRTSTKEQRSSSEKKYKTGKRLFRDPEDQVIGGVCSGIAAYFGIADPLWVRLGFVLFTISGGVGFPAYIILWAILKEAKTSSDRLAMRGDDINISNMAKIIEKEVTNFGDKITEMTENWDGSGKKKSFTEKAEFKQSVREGISFFGKGIRMAIEFLSVAIKPIIFIVGFALIIAFVALWLASIISFFVGFPLLQFLFPNQTVLGGVLIFNLAVFIGAPILSLILLAS